jgi:response regulator of citrate/malate metabolism
VITVLIVEDDPVSAEAMAVYVERVSGFAVGGRASTGAEALRRLATVRFGLVLLDVYLPDMTGLDVVRQMRIHGHTADVIVVTRARDLGVVHAAVSYGIVHYLVKPFTFAALRNKLETYRTYRAELSAAEPVVTQSEIDHLLSTLRGAGPTELPKGISRESLNAVVAALRSADTTNGLSAGEVAARVGASRVTVRRYLEYLAQVGLAVRRIRYGGAHRPEVEYRWKKPDAGDPHAGPVNVTT